MAWRTVVEADNERTELLELAGRGCLVRIVVRNAQGGWTPAALTWCPGLEPSDFAGVSNSTPQAEAPSAPAAAPTAPAQPSPAPEAAAAPANAPPPAQPAATPPAASAPQAAAPVATAAAPQAAAAAPAAQPSSAPDIVTVLGEFSRLQAVVAKAFRSKVRAVSGELGFLEDAPRVGSFSVSGEGDWVFRIDDTSVLLTSGNRVIELSLPKHLRDDGIDPNGVSRYLRAAKQTEVSYKGTGHAVDPETLDKLIKQLCADGVLRLFRSHPTPVYILAA